MSTPAVTIKQLIKEFPDPRSKEIVRAVNNISLEIQEGEFFAMLGPSGCGKTTTLRTIAGFEQPSSGEILIRGEAMQHVPPFHRPVNTVFQDYALFPHMSILQNIMFGLTMSKVDKKEAKKRAEEALELVQLPRVAGRKPHQLSGGQKQRVALARALVNRPAVLLLDEPLGALDLKLRKDMQFELKSMQQQIGITFVYVTHDQEEALTMADRIAVMNQGNLLQVGKPHEVYEKPADRFVADFIGETNFLDGVLVAKNGVTGDVRLGSGQVLTALLGETQVAVNAPVTVAVRPEKISLQPATTDEKPVATPDRAQVTGVISETRYIGTDTRYHVRMNDGSTLAVRVQNLHHEFSTMASPGDAVRLSWLTENAAILPA